MTKKKLTVLFLASLTFIHASGPESKKVTSSALEIPFVLFVSTHFRSGEAFARSGSFYRIYLGKYETEIADVFGKWKKVHDKEVFCVKDIMPKEKVFKFVSHLPVIQEALKRELVSPVDISDATFLSSHNKKKQD